MEETVITFSDGYEAVMSSKPLTWAQKEILRVYLMNAYTNNGKTTDDVSPEKIFDTRCKRIEYAISELRKDGVIVKFSKEWVMSLSQEDGKKLSAFVDSVDDKKKESSNPVKS